jgi:hypothetical protein
VTEGYCLVECDAVQSGISSPMFRGNMLSTPSAQKNTSSSTLQMEALCSSEMSSNFYQSTWLHIPENVLFIVNLLDIFLVSDIMHKEGTDVCLL